MDGRPAFDIAAAARACWPRFAALTAPEGAALLELQTAGVGFTALAQLYPFDFAEHLPLIFKRLAASPALNTIFEDPELASALSLLGFGITAIHFHHLEPVVREHAACEVTSCNYRSSRTYCALWWAYALVYVADRARLSTYPVSHPETVAAAQTIFATISAACATPVPLQDAAPAAMV